MKHFETINLKVGKVIMNGGKAPTMIFISVNFLDEIIEYYHLVDALIPLKDIHWNSKLCGMNMYRVIELNVIEVI